MTFGTTVSRDQAAILLNFAGRPDAEAVPRQLLDQQLEGAVAAHNLLQQRGVAYVADEVGTGKTLIAAGVLALLRHDDPDMRALVIAPRANLQDKWQRELRSFAAHNVRFPDLRVRGLGTEPVRRSRTPARLADLLTLWAEDDSCDAITRLSSYQLSHRQRTAEERRAYVEWWRPRLTTPGSRAAHRVLDEALRTAGGRGVKEAIAACANRLLPPIGVLIVDEAHNLKGGVRLGADRNRVLWTLLGHNDEFRGRLPGYGPRVERVLLLSATPLEDETDQLLAQLDVLGVTDRVPELNTEDEAERLDGLHAFLFRRLTKMRVGEQVLTRNRYREEWRAGGASTPDEPLPLNGARAQLTFALVQKRVADVLNNGGGGRQFQIGMLTSFESLAASTAARLPHRPRKDVGGNDGADDERYFDDAEQNQLATNAERRGIDASGISELVASHQAEFGRPPTHPKMDAVVERVVEGARRGRKALIFTRRVASVDELVQLVNDHLDRDLEERLRDALPTLTDELDVLFQRYRTASSEGADAVEAPATLTLAEGDPDLTDDQSPQTPEMEPEDPVDDQPEATSDIRGGRSLFAWLFRDNPTEGMLTGWWLRQRIEQQNGGYVTLLRENHVAAVLGCDPSEVPDRLRLAAPGLEDPLRTVDELAQRHLGGRAARIPTVTRFRAAQLAGLHFLEQHATGPVKLRAETALSALGAGAPTGGLPPRRTISVTSYLTQRTLATELRQDRALCAELWHQTLPWEWSTQEEFRRREWRWLMLTAAMRLDYPALDLWLCEVRRRGTLTPSDGELDSDVLIADFLAELRRQRNATDETSWSSYRALAALAADANLVLEVNGVKSDSDVIPAWIGNRLPAVGMSGQINATAVRQFRTPTFPLVLVSTDLLQEGEDLHTFCDEVHHYGIAWMPSSLEQRTGRVDRVNSLTERRLTRVQTKLGPDGRPAPEDRLNVLYPFVSGTYEQLQVRRVLGRLDKHIKLLHESFGQQVAGSPRLDPNEALVEDVDSAPSATNLGEPYQIDPAWLVSRRRRYPVVDDSPAAAAKLAFGELLNRAAWGPHPVVWLSRSGDLHLLGECELRGRYQPVDLRLTSVHGCPAVRVTSPVGLLAPDQVYDLLEMPIEGARIGLVRVGPRERRSFSVTVEDVALTPTALDMTAALEPRVVRVIEAADALERELLDTDARLGAFVSDLQREARHG